MRVQLLALVVVSCSFAVLASAQKPESAAHKRAAAAAPSGPARIPTPAGSAGPSSMLVNGSDSCTTPDVIVGTGPFSFDNTAATTGVHGQNEAACNFFNAPGITNDVWFTWTSPATGSATLSLCAGTSGMDSKVAVYSGAGCPGSAAIACNDDDCLLVSQVVFCATLGSSYTIQLGNFPGGLPSTGSFTILVAPPGVGNDECAAPIVLGAFGPYPFDNSAATTSCDGQGNLLCQFFGTPGITNDLWYTWTAPSTGIANLTLCATSPMDSKVAVYLGAGCPSGMAIACNDDACGPQSSMCFPVTGTQTYTIQLGNFPGAAGAPGTFDITIAPPPPPCRHDDGSSENLIGWLAGGEMVWMNRFGRPGSVTATVSAIQVVWGSPAFPGSGPPNGTPASVAVWEDPNDDGDPSDLVLLQLVGTTVANVDTDIYNFVPIPTVHAVGEFYMGAGLSHAPGQFVAPMDQTCPVPGIAWYFGNDNATPADYGNVLNNAQLPVTFNSVGFPAVVLVRGSCSLAPGSTGCEPGVNGVMTCACGNPPAGSARGCENSSGTGGATLVDTGVASLSADTVVFTTTAERPTALSVVLQGTIRIPGGVTYGDGIRCVGGVLKRLYVKSAVGGSITAPTGSDPLVHLRSAALGNPILPGESRFYQVYYRDPIAFGCMHIAGGATFNVSSGRRVQWDP